MNLNATQLPDFEKFVQYCKDVEGVTMTFKQDMMSRSVVIRLSKGPHNIQAIIDDRMLQTNYHIKVFQQTLDALKNFVNQQDAVGTAVITNMSIPLPDDWLPKELNMTQTQFDAEKIKIMKESARHVMNNSLVYGILAGGCFTSWYHQEVPKDFDVFVINEHSKDAMRKNALDTKRFKSTDGAYLNNGNIEQAILDTQTNIQYILVKYKTRKEIIDHFDAEHTAVSYDLNEDKLYISPSTYECIKNKILKPHNNNKIVHWREHKFKHKGFKLHETVSV